MKKSLGIILLLLLSISLFYSVNAASYSSTFLQDNVYKAIDIAKQGVSPVFEAVLGQSSTSEFFLAKSLLLILFFVVVLTITRKVPLFKDNKAVSLIVTIAVSILAIRFIPDEQFIYGILLPYTTFGIALTIFIPFLIFGYFVHEAVPGNFGRRAAWAVYGIIFVVLWFTRSGQIGDSNWIYLIGVALVLLAFVFDRSIHRYFNLQDFARAEKRLNQEQVVDLWHRYQKAIEIYNSTGSKAAEETVKTLKKRLKEAGENA
jgi:hypothetical protein